MTEGRLIMSVSDPVPGNVPYELIEAGLDVLVRRWSAGYGMAPSQVDSARRDVEAVLAAVLPVVRQQIADKIWREVNPHQASVHQAIDACARVVRGDP